MQINCRYCASEIPAANVNLDHLVAKCNNCNAVFDISGEIGAEGAVRRKRERPEIPLPRGIRVQDNLDSLLITRSWFSPAAFGLLFFSIFWNGFMVVWYTIAITQRELTMAVCGTLHLLVGVGVGYYTLTLFVNLTEIRLNRDQLKITHGPLPVAGNKTLETARIEQLYCREQVTHGKNSTSVTYNVFAVLDDQRREKLLEGLTAPEQALYLEQEIERYLGIENRPVSGEMHG